MSVPEFLQDERQPFEEDGFERKARKVFERMLREPSSLPAEYKAWLPPFIEQSNIQVPSSQVVGATQVAESVSKLGGNVHGRPGVVRVGVSPYDYFNLVYDAVADQWVSHFFLAADQSESFTTTNTSFQTIGSPYASAFIVPYGPFTDAGLKPQVRMMVFLTNDTAGTATATMAFASYDDGDVAAAGTGASWTIASAGTSTVIKDSGWQELPSLTKRDLVFGAFALKSSSGANTASIGGAMCWMRWVST